MIKNIIIIVSVAINVLFYFGLLEIGAYKKLVDSTIQTGSNIISKSELDKLVDLVKTETENGIGKELSSEAKAILEKIEANSKK